MKTIFVTILSTVTVMSLAAMLFFNSILGVFGLASTSVTALTSLKTSQQVVQKMKTMHEKRKLHVTKKLAKRSSRRVASAALAAATIGTVAVAVTLAGFEVHDYCEDKETLHNDQNILYGSSEKFSTEECLIEAKDETKRIITEVKQSSKNVVVKAIDSTTTYSNKKWLALKESAAQAYGSSSESTNTLWESTLSWLVKQ